MISVYPSNETAFADNGIKILKPLSAVVRKEDNGDYYLDLKDTIDNIEYYQSGNIARAPTPWGKQSFRFSNPSIENKKITCRAYHIYFDAANYIIADSYVVDKDCNDALDHLNSATDVTSPFTTLSDISTIYSYRCVRKSLEEAISDVIDRWGGHLVRDNHAIEIRQSIGQDRGVTLSYGKNISDIKADEDWSSIVTKLMPVGKDGLLLPEVWLKYGTTLYDIPYTKVVSFEQNGIDQSDYKTASGDDDTAAYNAALISDLRRQGLAYLNSNVTPNVNYTLSAYLKDISDVGDTIYVKHPKCKIDLVTSVIALEYNVISERFTKVEFGNFKSTLGNLLSNINSKITMAVAKSAGDTTAKLQTQLTEATNQIKGTLGNSYVVYDGDKILIVDTLPKEDATNVIMIDNGGIGFGQTGINGTFKSAWTIDGTMDMQNINVINLVADMIKGGTLKLGSALNESGILELYDGSNSLICQIDKDGITMYCQDGSYIKLNAEDGLVGYDINDNKIYWVDNDEFHMKKSVVEQEITVANKLRFIPVSTTDNTGIAVVATV
jgi:phage minor structural protein